MKLGVVEENLLFIKRQIDAVASGLSGAVACLKPTRGRDKLMEEHLKQRYIISRKGVPLNFSHFLQFNAREPAIQVSFRIIILQFGV